MADEKIYIKNKHMFKNKWQMIIYIILFCLLIWGFIYLGTKDYSKDITDQEKMAQSFNMLSEDNVFKIVNATDARMVANGKKGIVLFGTKNDWVNYYAYLVNKIAKEVGITEIYYYDFVKNRSDNNGTYEDIVEKLKNYVTYNDKGVGEIYAPSLLVVSNDNVLMFDTSTNFVKGNMTPSKYWSKQREDAKIKELTEVFNEYLKD